MRQVRQLAQITGLVLLLVSTMYGQRILQNAVSATGGAAAGVAGKPVSDSVNKIFGKVNKGVDKAAQAGQIEAVRKTPVELTPEQAAAAPQAVAAVPTRRAAKPAPTRANAAVTWNGTVPDLWSEQHHFDALQPEPRRSDLEELETGWERAMVLAQLGRPSVRVFIPEEGELREVYYFSGQGEHLGTVEMSNGVVQIVNVR